MEGLRVAGSFAFWTHFAPLSLFLPPPILSPHLLAHGEAQVGAICCTVPAPSC